MMHVIGNIDAIKKSIEGRYKREIEEIDRNISQQISEMKRGAEERISLMIAKMKVNAEQEAKKEEAKIISEERLKAKKDYEEKREQLINKVFREAEKEKLKRAHSKQYIDFVKAKLPKGKLTAIADSDFYKKYFEVDSWEIDNNIVGLKFQVRNMIFDFTLDSALESHREKLRHLISTTLW